MTKKQNLRLEEQMHIKLREKLVATSYFKNFLRKEPLNVIKNQDLFLPYPTFLQAIDSAL